jgi:hypothetical protein
LKERVAGPEAGKRGLTLTPFTDPIQGDGIPNGLENYFGTDPGTVTAGLSAGGRVGNIFTITHPRNAAPASDVSVAYRWSKDLANFHAGGASDDVGTTVTFTAQPSVPSPGVTTVTATVTGTAAHRLFVDVVATQTGP